MQNERGYPSNMPETERAPSPPYVSFLTFMNFISWLESEGIPLRFDRSFWQKKYSGTTGSQLISSLRFLGLLKDDEPQLDLHKLVEAKGENRNKLIADIIKRSYTKVDFAAIGRATPNMLSEWLKSYGIDKDTLRKAESFLINACKATDITISKPLSKKARNRPPKAGTGATGERKRRKEPTNASQMKPPNQELPANITGSVQTHTIDLSSGGEVTLTVKVNLFELSPDDMQFVLALVSKMKEYQVEEKH